jgi:hypothetical protein
MQKRRPSDIFLVSLDMASLDVFDPGYLRIGASQPGEKSEEADLFRRE